MDGATLERAASMAGTAGSPGDRLCMRVVTVQVEAPDDQFEAVA